MVTTRPIPAQHEAEVTVTSSTASENLHTGQPQTINPLLLDRSSELTTVTSELGSKGKFTFDIPINRRLGANGQEVDSKKPQGRNSDVLHKARALGMKIWALEKLQRIMNVMFDADTGYQIHGHNTRSNSVSTAIPRTAREVDLSQLLRNERINGPSDRDPTVASKELILFKGPYLYIHDIDEKQKPIMVREYSKVAHKEDGDWPQFRSVANGKCPFVEEIDYSKREVEKERDLRIQRQQEKEQAIVPRTRAAAAVEASKMHPPKAAASKRTLSEMEGANRDFNLSSRQSNPFAPKQMHSQRLDQEASSGRNAFVSRATGGRLFAGEPVASGVQPSNITSAIRSTVTSSTAAQPGAKTGTSKEVHGLQRKVLEKNSGGPGSYGLASSHRMTDLSTAAREEGLSQPVKGKGPHKLALIEEDDDPSIEEKAKRTEVARRAKAIHQRKLEKRDPKPGYCENCQDKFEDFDEVRIQRLFSLKHTNLFPAYSISKASQVC